MSRPAYPLRPYLPADTMALRELFAQSIEELTQDDYDEDQRAAWAEAAEDAGEFMKRLSAMTTLVVQQDGEYLGFASLKDDKHLDMLYVHPWHAGQGVGTALADALETIAKARGTAAITVEASETAVEFFERRGYEARQRNTIERHGEWLTNTTMAKQLKAAPDKAAGKRA